jgi:hypothetical protein
MNKEQTYYKTLTEVANILQIPYANLYKNRHRPEFTKSARGYNLKRITDYLTEQERIQEEEEKTKNLLGAEEELLEKQVKLEHTKLKCRLLELQILTKEGNLVDVNTVLETRTKELNRLRRSLTDVVRKLPVELANQDEVTIRAKLSKAVNNILADLSEFIVDDWSEATEEEQEIEQELELTK